RPPPLISFIHAAAPELLRSRPSTVAPLGGRATVTVRPPAYTDPAKGSSTSASSGARVVSAAAPRKSRRIEQGFNPSSSVGSTGPSNRRPPRKRNETNRRCNALGITEEAATMSGEETSRGQPSASPSTSSGESPEQKAVVRIPLRKKSHACCGA